MSQSPKEYYRTDGSNFRIAGHEPKALEYSSIEKERLTHYLLRYPAKFHPPVARALINKYSEPGMRLLDPFCGSGTTLVECVVAGRSAVGTDIDPLAVFASKVKTENYDVSALEHSCERVLKEFERYDRGEDAYKELMHRDISMDELGRYISSGLWVPDITNITHWFRKYVIIDLSHIVSVIRRSDIPTQHRNFLLLCFASIIRNASNADPVPVSGLEVTAHMRRRDEAGRIVDPFRLMIRAVRRGLQDVRAFANRARRHDIVVLHDDARRLQPDRIGICDVAITSPPYSGAVDYYRRHQLETLWLGLTPNNRARQGLKHLYIGRTRVLRAEATSARSETLGPVATQWDRVIRNVSPHRADAFRAYVVALTQSLESMARVLVPAAPVVCVVGHSRWRGQELPVAEIVAEAARRHYVVDDVLFYQISNRYMSYSRHNGADINRDYIVILRKRS